MPEPLLKPPGIANIMYFALTEFALVTPSSSFCDRTRVKPDCTVFHASICNALQVIIVRNQCGFGCGACYHGSYSTIRCRHSRHSGLMIAIAAIAVEDDTTALSAALLPITAAIAVEDDTTALSAALLPITAAIAVWDDTTALCGAVADHSRHSGRGRRNRRHSGRDDTTALSAALLPITAAIAV